jgi:hypothetical protein
MPRPRTRAAVLYVVVLLVACAATFVPFLERDREVLAATPSPPPLFELTEVPLAPGSRLCLRDVELVPEGQVARLRTTSTFAAGGPRLAVVAQGAGYRFAGEVAGYPGGGALDLPIRPPARDVRGSLCVRNLGRRRLLLVATGEPRTRSEPVTVMDGRPVDADVALSLVERDRVALADRLTEVLRHASTFRPGLLTPVTIGVLALLVLVGVPLGALLALSRGVDDQP